MMAQTALVLGGSGYVGNVLVDELMQHGARCINADIVPPHAELCPYEPVDIRNPDEIRNLLRKHRPQLVVNSTAAVPLVRSEKLFEEINVHGVRTLLQECLEARVPKCIHISTCGIFGIPRRVPITDQSPPTPVEGYGRSKTKGEAVVREFVERGLDVTILRPRSMMGYRRLGIFHVAFELIRCGRTMWTFGPGTNRIQFLHVRDFVRAVRLASQRPGAGLYNIGAERFGTLREDLQQLAEAAATGSRVSACPRWLALGVMKALAALRLSPVVPYQFLLYAHDIYFDVEPAKKELGWSSKYSNAEMMIESYRWYVDHHHELHQDTDRSVQRVPLKLGMLKLLKYLPI
jgi:nucleoside-diphosphate-sugar epimerase